MSLIDRHIFAPCDYCTIMSMYGKNNASIFLNSSHWTPRKIEPGLSNGFDKEHYPRRKRFIDIWNSIIREASLPTRLEMEPGSVSTLQATLASHRPLYQHPRRRDGVWARANMNKDKCRWLANCEAWSQYWTKRAILALSSITGFVESGEFRIFDSRCWLLFTIAMHALIESKLVFVLKFI